MSTLSKLATIEERKLQAPSNSISTNVGMMNGATAHNGDRHPLNAGLIENNSTTTASSSHAPNATRYSRSLSPNASSTDASDIAPNPRKRHKPNFGGHSYPAASTDKDTSNISTEKYSNDSAASSSGKPDAGKEELMQMYQEMSTKLGGNSTPQMLAMQQMAIQHLQSMIQMTEGPESQSAKNDGVDSAEKGDATVEYPVTEEGEEGEEEDEEDVFDEGDSLSPPPSPPTSSLPHPPAAATAEAQAQTKRKATSSAPKRKYNTSVNDEMVDDSCRRRRSKTENLGPAELKKHRKELEIKRRQNLRTGFRALAMMLKCKKKTQTTVLYAAIEYIKRAQQLFTKLENLQPNLYSLNAPPKTETSNPLPSNLSMFHPVMTNPLLNQPSLQQQLQRSAPNAMGPMGMTDLSVANALSGLGSMHGNMAPNGVPNMHGGFNGMMNFGSMHPRQHMGGAPPMQHPQMNMAHYQLWKNLLGKNGMNKGMK